MAQGDWPALQIPCSSRKGQIMPKPKRGPRTTEGKPVRPIYSKPRPKSRPRVSPRSQLTTEGITPPPRTTKATPSQGFRHMSDLRQSRQRPASSSITTLFKTKAKPKIKNKSLVKKAMPNFIRGALDARTKSFPKVRATPIPTIKSTTISGTLTKAGLQK